MRRKSSKPESDQTGGKCIARLRELTAALFEQVVERVIRGERLQRIAGWLVEQGCGGQALGVHSFRKLLTPLRRRIIELKRSNPGVNRQLLLQQLERNERRRENDAAILGVPHQPAANTAAEVESIFANISAKWVFTAAYLDAERELVGYQSLAEKIKMPVEGSLKTIDRKINIALGLAKLEGRPPKPGGVHNTAVKLAEDLGDASSAEEQVVPAAAADPELDLLHEWYPRMSEADRMLARHEMGMIRRALKLDRIEAEKAAKTNAKLPLENSKT